MRTGKLGLAEILSPFSSSRYCSESTFISPLFIIFFTDPVKIRQKQCPEFEELWGRHGESAYNYEIPSKSFCSDFCSNDKPYWFECSSSILPTIQFFFAPDRSCYVQSAGGIRDKNNQRCIERVTSAFSNSNFTVNKMIYITHGFQGYQEGNWLWSLKDSLLNRYGIGNTVVGVVIWSRGSKSRGLFERETWFLHRDVVCCYSSWVREYGVAAANTWPIGNVLAYVNEKIVSTHNSKALKTYCIGHSLGSHLCGFFGKMSKKLDKDLTVEKIIGLDPAGPIWDYNDDLLQQDPNLRLNKDDALHVEVFHTDAKGLGSMYPLGDLDFYINGGNIQPMCKQLGNLLDMHSCCHAMAWQFYETLNKVDSPRCNAIWKCPNSSESQLTAIENEIPSQLESQNCVTSAAIKVGDLDSRGQGVYWIDVDENSKTCDYGGYVSSP